ncbi:hypothetical protein REPUB_Repub05bG0090000 [Reevesia pubescens]
MAIAFMLLYTKLANVLSKKALFYTVIVPFIAFFGAFGFLMYPLSNHIQPKALANKLLCGRFCSILGVCQLDNYCRLSEEFYRLFGLGANVAFIFFCLTVKYFSNLRKNLGPEVDGWAIFSKAVMSIVVLIGVTICFLY